MMVKLMVDIETLMLIISLFHFEALRVTFYPTNNLKTTQLALIWTTSDYNIGQGCFRRWIWNGCVEYWEMMPTWLSTQCYELCFVPNASLDSRVLFHFKLDVDLFIAMEYEGSIRGWGAWMIWATWQLVFVAWRVWVTKS